jgi:hypothetical protein
MAAIYKNDNYVNYEDRASEDGSVLYGMDVELAEKAKGKYDPKMEVSARAWIEAVLGEPLGAGSLQAELKSGEVLCRVINTIKPGSVKKINQMKMPFMQMENIGAHRQRVPCPRLHKSGRLWPSRVVVTRGPRL